VSKDVSASIVSSIRLFGVEDRGYRGIASFLPSDLSGIIRYTQHITPATAALAEFLQGKTTDCYPIWKHRIEIEA
jgi:hypothetical protein